MKKLLQRSILGILAISLLIIPAGCTKKTEDLALRIGSMPTQTASIYAIGIEKGFFKNHHVNATLTIFPSAIERDSAATAGAVDGFLTDIMGAVNLREHSFPFKITSSEYENFCVMGTKLTSPQKGSTIAVANNTVTEYIAEATGFAGENELVNIPKVPERLAALNSEKVGFGVFPEPFVSIIKSTGGRVIASSAEMGLQPVVFVFSESYLKGHPSAVKDFYGAYNEIIEYLKVTPYKEYKDVLIQYKLVSPELAEKIALPVDQYSHRRSVTKKDVEGILLWMSKKAMIKNTYTYEDLVAEGYRE